MRWCLRLVVQSQVMYLLRALSQFAGTEFPDRQIIDVPLCSAEQYMASKEHDGAIDASLIALYGVKRLFADKFERSVE